MPAPFDRAVLARVLPFVAFMALLGVRGAAPADGSWGLDPRWIYGVGVAVVGALLLFFWRDYGELARQNRPSGGDTALAVVVGLLVFGAWIHLDAPWMTFAVDSVGFVPTAPDGALLWPLIAVRWLGAALLVPVMEELFWRSFLMRWIQHPRFAAVAPQQVGPKAVLLSTFVFVLAHPLWLAAALAGLAYAWLYIRTGRLWVPVIAHAVTNGALGVWVVATGNWAFW